MKTWRTWKTMIAIILVLSCIIPSVAFAEDARPTTDGIFSVSLESLTDEELEKVATAILEEQRSRIKTNIVLDIQDEEHKDWV